MRTGAWIAACLLVAGGPASAATIVERIIDLEISGRSVTERLEMVVSIDEPGDTTAWSKYVFIDDEDIELLSCNASVVGADGAVVRTVRERDYRRETSVGTGLHSSAAATTIPFGPLSVGNRVRIELVRRRAPIFSAHAVVLGADEPQQSLAVRVRGGHPHLRWSLQACEDLVVASETESGLVVSGTDIPAEQHPDYAPDDDSALPMLRLAWNEDPSWAAVGSWFTELVDRTTTSSPTAQELARTLTADATSNRERIMRLSEYAKRTIRYEAVEIGTGGWIPSPADEVLQRGWGDCKDKAQLLRVMLGAVGIPAHLVLLRSGRTGRIDINFPSTLGFNHCIVAVPTDQVETTEDDPVVDGLLFLDPTMDRGHPLWLSPFDQGHWVVVAAGSASRLVQLPIHTSDERRLLMIEGVISDDGRLDGAAVLRLKGARALPWVRDLDSESPQRIEESIRHYLESTVPGADITRVGWMELDDRAPSIHLQASFTVEGFVRGSPARRRIRPAMLTAYPESRELENRTQPVVLSPGVHRTVWRLTLPDGWCEPEPVDLNVRNSVGSLSATVASDDTHHVVIDRTIVIHRWWYGTESLDHLRELSVAESRLSRESVRLTCDRETASAPQ